MGASRSNSDLIQLLNHLAPVAVYSSGNKLYLLVHHWKQLDWKNAKRALIASKITLPKGSAYIPRAIINLNQIRWDGKAQD